MGDVLGTEPIGALKLTALLSTKKDHMSVSKTVLITGCSSGLGLCCAELFAAKGWNVVATTRRKGTCEKLSKLTNVLVITMDVTSDGSVRDGVATALQRFGTMDVVVNNAGYAVSGPLELATSEQVERQLSTNVHGPIRVIQAVLPSMRRSGAGTIVNVSSMGAHVAMPLHSLYVASKFALNGMSESVAMELAPFGVRVRVVEPGAIRTRFTANLEPCVSNGVRAYDPLCKAVTPALETLMDAGSEAADIAKVVYDAATCEDEKFRFVAGEDAIQSLALRKSMTDEEHRQAMLQLLGAS